MKFYTVDVKNITCNVPQSNFAIDALNSLADMIIESGGIIRPLILKTTGLETYTVVDGQFEYYAAVRAREKNPRQCEMVNAFVISPQAEDLIVKQATFIRGVESYDKPVNTITETTSSDSLRLTNLELLIEKQINEFKSELLQEKQRVDDKFKEFANKIPQGSDALNLLNTLEKEDLSVKLQRSKIPTADKIAQAIVDARRSKKPKPEFEDYRDVVKSVKNLGEKRILTIIDEWGRS